MCKTGSIILIILLSIILSFCQSNNNKIDQSNVDLKKENKAENDHEFDKGSNIASIEINDHNIENLALLGKIWGFLKYYHPNIAKGYYNWDYELFRVLPKLINAKNSIDRDEILLKWINSFGDFQEKEGSPNFQGEIKIRPDLDWITNSNLMPDLVEKLTLIRNAKRTDQNYYIKISFAGNPVFKTEFAYSKMKYPDTGFRLLALFDYWNIIQYYFPYRNLIEEDWRAVLKEFIPKFIDDRNELEYKLTVWELIARIHDTHADIWGIDSTLNKYKGLRFAPVEIGFVENKAVVVGYFDENLGRKSGLLKGDIISKINNKSVAEIINEKIKYTCASNYTTQLRKIAPNLFRTNDSILQTEFSRDDKIKVIGLKTDPIETIDFKKKYQKLDTCFKFIKQDIGYLYLGTIKSENLSKIMEEIKNTKGLIIDIRCYPSEFVVFSLGEYLMPKSTAFVKFSNGSVKSPGLFTLIDKVPEIGKNNDNFYKGKVVILINEITQSQAEYTAMALRVSPTATVIGSTTAGADGNVSEYNFPGGIKTKLSGIGVYYPDGKETQRVGIIPDIVVRPTILGIKQNRDEILEKAIEIIME